MSMKLEPLKLKNEVPYVYQLNAAYERNRLDHHAQLDVDSRPSPIKLTGVMVTLGITNSYPSAIADIVKAGANLVRLNMCHETDKWHVITIRSVRQAGNKLYKNNNEISPIGVAIDLCGPQIRTGLFRGDPDCMIRASRSPPTILVLYGMK